MRGRSAALLVALVAFLLFAALRSRDYTQVDGALRCVEVFHRQTLFFHENNHLLYPANVLVWHRLLATAGLEASSPLEFLPLTQLMNAAAAAVTLAAFSSLLWIATASPWAALLGAALLGLSRAFLLHATNSAEPMVGLMWSCLAVLLLVPALRRRSLLLAAGAGGLFALALATYQSMALAAPIGLVLCLGWRRDDRSRGSLPTLLALTAGGLLGTVLIFGASYLLAGIRTPEDMFQKFFTVVGAQTFGTVSLRKPLLVPLGLASNLVDIMPDGFSGFRSLLRDVWALPPILLAVLGVLSIAALVAARTRRAWDRLPAAARLGVAASLTGFCATVIAPATWEPLYDKLWLQPIACLTFLLVIALASDAFPVRGKQAGLLLTLVLAPNLVESVADHRGATPGLREAEQVARRVAPQDLVVHDWGRISVLYATIWGQAPGRHTFDLPTRALRSGPRALDELGQDLRSARDRGGRIWFLGVLDQPPGMWREFLDKKAGLPYESFQPYRDGARIMEDFPDDATAVTLRLWEPHFAP